MKLYKYLSKTILIFSCLFCISANNVLAYCKGDFADINSHWAKSSIIALVQDNILNGYSDNTFRPDSNITVAEFLKIIIVAGDYELVRVGKTLWPDSYIATALEKGLIKENEFLNYDDSITRYQVVRIISRFINLDDVKTSKNKFKDLSNEYKDDVLKLVNLKIINGYGDKTFRGEKTITRAEAATIVKKSIENKRSIDFKEKCDVSSRIDLSNYGSNANIDDAYSETRYEIENNNLKIYDSGRYSNSWGYTINNEIIDTSKIVKIIKKLIHDETYTAVIYSPSKYTINQLRISHGGSATKLLNGEEDFSFTYYEDKYYELGRISMNEEFSDECYLKIEVVKLWEDYSKYLEGNYVDEYKKEKLLDALEVEFGNNNAKNILKYMIEKNEDFVSNKDRDKEHVEKRRFGDYIINFYQKEYGVPEFYISKVK